MADELNLLLKNDVLSDDVKADIMESWTSKLEEAKEQITAEIRDEFARKYNKDKGEIVEAMNVMIQSVLTPVLEELSTEKQAAIAEQVRYKKAIRENIKSFNKFTNKVLAEEVCEFRQDRKTIAENMHKMEKFMQSQVSIVLEDFHSEKRRIAEEAIQARIADKKELVETKIKLVKEQASKAAQFINKIVTEEMTQLKDELQEARKNDFGSRIYESVIAEVRANFFNENKEVKKLVKAIKERDSKLEESKKALSEQLSILEESRKEVRVAKERLARERVLNELLSPLSNEKRAIMEEMLHKQPTVKLRESFERYLPSVMDETSTKTRRLDESNFKEVTGDRKNNIISETKKSEDKRLISEYVNKFKQII